MNKVLAARTAEFGGRTFNFFTFNGVVFYTHPDFIKDGGVQFPIVDCHILRLDNSYLITQKGDWNVFLFEIKGRHVNVSSDDFKDEDILAQNYDKYEDITTFLIASRKEKILLYWDSEKGAGTTLLYKDGRVETLPGITKTDYCQLWLYG